MEGAPIRRPKGCSTPLPWTLWAVPAAYSGGAPTNGTGHGDQDVMLVKNKNLFASIRGSRQGTRSDWKKSVHGFLVLIGAPIELTHTETEIGIFIDDMHTKMFMNSFAVDDCD